MYESNLPNVLVIKDLEGNIFGGFCNESWRKKSLFYGTGETFLFTFKKSEKITVYYWTHKNNYFMHSGTEGLCLGTG